MPICFGALACAALARAMISANEPLGGGFDETAGAVGTGVAGLEADLFGKALVLPLGRDKGADFAGSDVDLTF